jgi:hypothetical protein
VETFLKIIVVAIGILGLGLIISLISAIPVYFLWNWLMPELFHLPAVTFWQALGITTLANILFKSNSSSKSKE